MPCQDSLGVGPGFPADSNPEHDVVVGEVIRLRSRDMGRMVQRRNAVHDDPAPIDFIQADGGLDADRKEIHHPTIALAVQGSLERAVVGMRIIGQLPHPSPPPSKILSKILARLLPEKVDQTLSDRRWRPHQPRDVDEDGGVAILPARGNLFEGGLGLTFIRAGRLEKECHLRRLGLLRTGRRCRDNKHHNRGKRRKSVHEPRWEQS